ncbi:MAG: multicopper oxidase family protein [Thermodesulfobacteriota bacterium]
MKRRNLDRRDFLKFTSMGLAGAYLGLRGDPAIARMGGGRRGMGMMGGGQVAVIDPPPGSPFQDPPVMANQSRQPGRVEVNLEAKVAPVRIGGVEAQLLTYNGSYPGPTIKVRRGDRLQVHFKNSLSMLGNNLMGHDRDITNLHTHGLHVSPSGNSDNVMIICKTGETFVYDYDLSKQSAGTLNLYHPHIHGSVAEQMWGGLVGALEVADEVKALAGYETHLLLLKDISLIGGYPAAYTSMMDYMQGKEGDMVTVNGQVNPVLRIKLGQVQRWKIINTSNARFYRLSLENHPLHVIGTEGGLLDRPYTMGSVLLSPAERVDLLVKADQGQGNYRLLSLPYNRFGHCMGAMGATQQVTLLTLSYSGGRAPDELVATVNPEARRVQTAVAKTEQLTLSMGHGMGMGMMGMGGMGRGMGMMGMGGMGMGRGMGMMGMMGMGQGMAAINGITFELAGDSGGPLVLHGSDGQGHGTGAGDPHGKMIGHTIHSKVGTYEIWEIFNHSMMDHPFHQHVNSCQVLAVYGGDPEYAALYTTAPAWKDVVLVPAMGSVRVLMPVMDFDGTSMFHCHIVEHEDMGMMGIWNIS